jgi:hypothetical protein
MRFGFRSASFRVKNRVLCATCSHYINDTLSLVNHLNTDWIPDDPIPIESVYQPHVFDQWCMANTPVASRAAATSQR